MKVIDSAAYFLTQAVAWVFCRVLAPARVPKGFEIMKNTNAPFLVVSNHVTFFDCVYLGIALRPHKTYFLAKSELFRKPILRWYLSCLGAVPVDRHTADITAIKNSLQAIKQGNCFALFPEGTRNMERNHQLQKFYPGIGLIALKAKVPVIPVCFTDRRGVKMFRKTTFIFGEPIVLDDLYKMGKINSDSIDVAVERMRLALEALLQD